ncbi:MAG: dihydrodipicolinate synthase family protein [Beijerinckiaceae bacterium]
MAATGERIGLNCALSTPFSENGAIDLRRMSAHAVDVLAKGCDGITAFGTTGEGASISVPERHQALAALATTGIDLRSRVFAGVSAASVEDTVAQARAGYDMDCRGLLLAPPFYFGQASDDGLFRFFAVVFEKLGGQLRDVILYHIPGMTRNGISVELTQRLVEAFPGVVTGVKDSNGDWAATERRLKELEGLQILVGDERQLARAVHHGGAGTICGLANIAPDLLRPLAHEGEENPRVNAMVEAIVAYSFMSAVKAMIGEMNGDPAWRIMRPPLDAMPVASIRTLAATLAAVRAGKAA